MNLKKYQAQAFQTAQIDWDDPIKHHVPAFGVIGELGSLISELKKSIRDGDAYTDGTQNLIEEFGDVLWYLSALCSHYGFNLSTLVDETPYFKLEKAPFSHVYALARTIPPLTDTFERLASPPTSAQRRALAKNIGRSARLTLQALAAQHLQLGAVLDFNLGKVQSMFGPDIPGPAPCFDGAAYPAYERLPRKLHIQFLERERGRDRVEVILRVGDLNIGDRLTDNAAIDDGYRYHDAFHFAYVAVLGWSPVTRAILRCKRKSDGQKDEIEDGARAIIIEEAIAHTVFNYALGHSMLEGLDRLDHNLLKLIERMVRNLEVRACKLHEWQRAVLTGFAAFRALTTNHGGWLLLDAETQSLTYSREGPGAA